MAEVVIVADAGEGGAVAADLIEQLVLRSPDAVLGLATGSTPLSTWAALAQRHLQLLGQGQQQLRTRVGATGLDEAQVPRRDAGIQGQCHLADPAAVTPAPDQGADRLAATGRRGAQRAKGLAVANHIAIPVAMMKAPSVTPAVRKNLACRRSISSG